MKLSLVFFGMLLMLLAGCTKSSTMKVYSDTAKDTVELHISDVPVDSVCAVEIWAKYPEDWTCGCDAYLASRKTLGTMALVLIAIPVVMIMACLPFIMAGGM